MIYSRLKTLREKAGKTQADVSKYLGFKRVSRYANYESGHSKPSVEIMQKISKYFGVDINYLIDGKGKKDVVENIPYYDIDATGEIEVVNDYDESPSYFMHLPNFKDCDFACNVSGDSMYPQICSGEVILCKEVKNTDIIQFGETYLVVCNEKADYLRTIKRIRKNKSNPNVYILNSANPDFDDFEIPINSIDKLYTVKGSMKRRVM